MLLHLKCCYEHCISQPTLQPTLLSESAGLTEKLLIRLSIYRRWSICKKNTRQTKKLQKTDHRDRSRQICLAVVLGAAKSNQSCEASLEQKISLCRAINANFGASQKHENHPRKHLSSIKRKRKLDVNDRNHLHKAAESNSNIGFRNKDATGTLDQSRRRAC